MRRPPRHGWLEMSTGTQCSGLSSRARPTPVRQLLLSVVPEGQPFSGLVATRTQDAGGLLSRVRVEMAFLTISVASACWAVEAVRATTAATAYGGSQSPSQAGVFGFNFGLGPGLRGYSAVPTAGQRAQPTGNGVGVEGKSGGGKGVHGSASASPGIGFS